MVCRRCNLDFFLMRTNTSWTPRGGSANKLGLLLLLLIYYILYRSPFTACLSLFSYIVYLLLIFLYLFIDLFVFFYCCYHLLNIYWILFELYSVDCKATDRWIWYDGKNRLRRMIEWIDRFSEALMAMAVDTSLKKIKK